MAGRNGRNRNRRTKAVEPGTALACETGSRQRRAASLFLGLIPSSARLKERIMPTGNGSLTDFLGILAVFLLVAANGFFVAAEFSMVAVRRSRVQRRGGGGNTHAEGLDRPQS